MDEYAKLAADIIDELSDWIEAHYDFQPKSFDDPSLESPALINGASYYELEGWIAARIKTLVRQRRARMHSRS